MADTDHEPHVPQFLEALRQHVFTPLETATRAVEREQTEVTAELDAFETFAARLAMIEPVTQKSEQGQQRMVACGGPSADRMEQVRIAYRETVMSVPHYDEVYGESLVDNVAAEYGSDLAAGIHAETSMAFHPSYKTALQTATAQAKQERRTFLDTLDRERRSVETARTDLTELIAQLDTTTLPEWYRETFADRLDRIVRARQETIQTRRTVPRLQNHALCEYLYQTNSWTYPVLTAVTRTREAVDM